MSPMNRREMLSTCTALAVLPALGISVSRKALPELVFESNAHGRIANLQELFAGCEWKTATELMQFDLHSNSFDLYPGKEYQEVVVNLPKWQIGPYYGPVKLLRYRNCSRVIVLITEETKIYPNFRFVQPMISVLDCEQRILQ